MTIPTESETTPEAKEECQHVAGYHGRRDQFIGPQQLSIIVDEEIKACVIMFRFCPKCGEKIVPYEPMKLTQEEKLHQTCP